MGEIMNDDLTLLREYARGNSEEAFATLVSRYVNLVYSVALRQVRDPQLAEEITQAVFIILARKAGSLGDKTILAGWLCRTARYASANALTIQRRRQRREQEASMQNILNELTADDTWMQIAPLLDAAMGKLGQKDHDALVLRFFQNKNFAEVGAALGASEGAAKTRVHRALEKLHRFLSKHGISSTTAIISGGISTNSIQVAPISVLQSATAAAFTKGAASSASTLTLAKGALKLMAWTKAKTTAITGAVIILATTSTVTSTIYFLHFHFLQTHRLPTGKVTPMVAYGYSHFGVVLASNGSLWSWGENRFGWPTLGISNLEESTSLRRIGSETNWVDIAAGDADCLAVKSDGTLWGWGENLNYQLGDGTKITRPTPVPSIPGNDWKQAATGGSASFAIKNDGTLWAWGNNWAGNLGTGDTKDRTNAVQIGTSTNWEKIWAGGIQTVGLQNDGSLWFWGTFTGDATSKTIVPTRISPDTNWVDVCFGYFTVFAIKSEGTLWTWGREANFYTGVADTNLNTKPMQVGTDTDWQSCSSAAGGFYHLLQEKDGSFWALDASEHRTIKPASAYEPIILKKINLPEGVVAFTAGGDNLGVALTRDGEVWTWGNVIGDHSASDYFGPNPREVKQPKIKVRNEPWLLSISD